LCGLDEVIEDAVGEEADVCGLHQVEKIDHHALERDQHDREFLDGFAAVLRPTSFCSQTAGSKL
jgi:hypothetical protein